MHMALREGIKLITSQYTEASRLNLSTILIISRVQLDFGQHFQARQPMRASATVSQDKQRQGRVKVQRHWCLKYI